MSITSMTSETRGTGVKTPGIGKRTTVHLNLTRSLADVGWPENDHPTRGTDPYDRRPGYQQAKRTYESHDPRFRFAGAE